jgi:hypothetical protein
MPYNSCAFVCVCVCATVESHAPVIRRAGWTHIHWSFGETTTRSGDNQGNVRPSAGQGIEFPSDVRARHCIYLCGESQSIKGRKGHEINVPSWPFHGQQEQIKSPKTLPFRHQTDRPVGFVVPSFDIPYMRIDGFQKKEKKKEPLRHLQETFNNNFQIFVFRVLVKTDPESG